MHVHVCTSTFVCITDLVVVVLVEMRGGRRKEEEEEAEEGEEESGSIGWACDGRARMMGNLHRGSVFASMSQRTETKRRSAILHARAITLHIVQLLRISIAKDFILFVHRITSRTKRSLHL
jgi:hypothetical protein